MLESTPRSPVPAQLQAHRIAVHDVDCERVAPPGTNPFFRPLGSCEYLGEAYAKAPAYSIFTRHSVVGEQTSWRLFINGIHLFGALSTIVCLVALALSRGMTGTSSLNALAKRLFISSTYTMWLTGFVLYLLQQEGDTGFFPRIASDDMPWLRHALFLAFSVSFLNVMCHANLDKSKGVRLLVAQHLVGSMAWLPLLTVLIYRLFTLDMQGYQWMYTFELVSLVSLYPVLDIVNGWVLYQTRVRGHDYEWKAHNNDNLIIFWVVVVTVVLFFVGNDKHYFFQGQLPPVYRLALIFVAPLAWIVSGAFAAWIRRAYRA